MLTVSCAFEGVKRFIPSEFGLKQIYRAPGDTGGNGRMHDVGSFAMLQVTKLETNAPSGTVPEAAVRGEAATSPGR